MRVRSKSAPVGVLTKVLAIIELLDRAPAGLQLKEIAEKTSMNKSTVHRFASHLESEAYLFRDQSGAYSLGPKLARLGGGMSYQSTLCQVCRPTIERLARTTGETINLAVLDGADVLYIDVIETLNTFRLVSQVGTRRPFYCTSLGKAIVANMEPGHMLDKLLATVPFEEGTLPKTLNSLSRFKRALQKIRECGFALDEGEAVAGIRCVGAAIVGADGQTVGGISISGPTVRVTRECLPLFTAEICTAAREIAARLAPHASSPTRIG